ncbi:hypothetical protein [Altericroceibacterium endophyticum]|uniref:Uncharacterized protein n=1 Tax=Altericroceibacterium endophyticum TaxID=1808508 RepID=A0A6I4T8P3_9SPHN|nr:hypothetical protein [Altericroceibacterium endophyticum]MXO66250.1 hypothetical protein [Altericroceibacterium endophyticum]
MMGFYPASGSLASRDLTREKVPLGDADFALDFAHGWYRSGSHLTRDFAIPLSGNLIVNGDFSDGLNGWGINDEGTSVTSVVDGRARMYAPDGDYAILAQDPAGLPVGSRFVLSVDAETLTGGAAYLQFSASKSIVKILDGGFETYDIRTAGSLGFKRISVGNPNDVYLENVVLKRVSATSYRAGECWDIDANGRLHHFKSHEPVILPGRGALFYGPLTAMASQTFTPFNLPSTCTKTALPPDDVFLSPVRLASEGYSYSRTSTERATLPDGVSIFAIGAIIEFGSSGQARLQWYDDSQSPGDNARVQFSSNGATQLFQGSVTSVLDAAFIELADGKTLIWATFENTSEFQDATFGVGPESNVVGEYVDLYALWMTPGSSPFPIIPTFGTAASITAQELAYDSPITEDDDFVLWIEADPFEVGGSQVLGQFDDGTLNNRVVLLWLPDGRPAFRVFSEGVQLTAGVVNDGRSAVGVKSILALSRQGGVYRVGNCQEGSFWWSNPATESWPSGISSISLGQQSSGSLPALSNIQRVMFRRGTFSRAEIEDMVEGSLS